MQSPLEVSNTSVATNGSPNRYGFKFLFTKILSKNFITNFDIFSQKKISIIFDVAGLCFELNSNFKVITLQKLVIKFLLKMAVKAKKCCLSKVYSK